MKAALALPPRRIRDGKAEKTWLGHLVRPIPETDGRALELFGYFDARARTERKTAEEGNILVVVHGDPGQPVAGDEVRVEGALQSRAQDLGYLDARSM